MKTPRVSNEEIKNDALRRMSDNGMPLVRKPTSTRSMIYEAPDGKTVRIRTTNDPILVVVAKGAAPNASLNIEGTDFLLIAMPHTPRTPGPIDCYLVPTEVAVRDVKAAYASWLNTNPNTKGDNKTRNIWFDDRGQPWSGFSSKWEEYVLPAEQVQQQTLRVKALESAQTDKAFTEPTNVASVIEQATNHIAQLSGIPREKIKVEVKFEL